jgi:hypothetical protein
LLRRGFAGGFGGGAFEGWTLFGWPRFERSGRLLFCTGGALLTGAFAAGFGGGTFGGWTLLGWPRFGRSGRLLFCMGGALLTGALAAGVGGMFDGRALGGCLPGGGFVFAIAGRPGGACRTNGCVAGPFAGRKLWTSFVARG